jgi:hypothetical protein
MSCQYSQVAHADSCARLQVSEVQLGASCWLSSSWSCPPHMQPVLRGHLLSAYSLLWRRLALNDFGWIPTPLSIPILSLPKRQVQRMVKADDQRHPRAEKQLHTSARLNHVAFVIPAARHFTGRTDNFEENLIPDL